MRAIILTLALALASAWLGFELREQAPQWSKLCFTLAVFFLIVLAVFFYGLWPLDGGADPGANPG